MGSLCFNYLYSVLPFSPALGIHPWYALDVVFASRNAHLKYFRSSIFQKIWIKIPLTVMDQKLLNCRDCQMPRSGQVLGLVGTNGIGKSTAPVFRSVPEIELVFLHGGFWKYNTTPSNIFPLSEDIMDAKNGPEFEVMIREKQEDNPAYSFLFGGEGHNYYRYKLWLSTRSSAAAGGFGFNVGHASNASTTFIYIYHFMASSSSILSLS